jgi:V8-like Glu-specific endopeptidase
MVHLATLPVDAAVAGRGEAQLIGGDDRRLVLDTEAIPYRWICCLDLYFRDFSDPDNPDGTITKRGTGTLVGPRHVLTAAHNLYDQVPGSGTRARQRVRAVRVTPGLNDVDEQGDRLAPFGWSYSSVVRYSDRWRSSRDEEFDYGLVILRQPIGSVAQEALGGRPLGFWGGGRDGTRIRPRPASALRGALINISGYPMGKCGSQPPTGSFDEVEMRSCPLNRRASTQWRVSGTVLGFSAVPARREFHHSADSWWGYSGSPVWLRWRGVRNLVGILTGENEQGVSNRAVRITDAVMRDVRSWMA